jgi:hypothetical protein
MKTLLCLTIALGTLASPALTFAQTAEQQVQPVQQVQQAQPAQAQDAVGGASATGSSGSSERMSGKQAGCTGPASFCNIFFGS